MDSGNNRVLRYNPGSNYGVTVATTSFNTPRGMRLDSIGNLYVTDLSQRVIKFPCGRCNFIILTNITLLLLILKCIMPPRQHTQPLYLLP
jgi:hypothetical protein